MSRVYHYCPSITRRDAIGYSLMILHRAMLRAGIRSYLVSDQEVVMHAPPSTLGFNEFEALKPNSDDLVLFHYSFRDRNATSMMALSCRKIMIYHNITPGNFFRSAGQHHVADHCDAGRAFLNDMKDSFDAVVADSAYNAHELVNYGFPTPRVIPVFYNDVFFANGSHQNEEFLARRLAGELSLVFIGRYVPNKRPDNLIRVAATLKNLFKLPVRLRLHGKVWDRNFLIELRRLAEHLGVEHEVSFEQNQPQAALRTSLASADAFVSASEHEGFMVPLVEAFSAGCPVVAVASTAVTETCGPAGCLVHTSDMEEVAAHIVLISRDRELRQTMIRTQSARAADFAEARTMGKWNALLSNFIEGSLVADAHRV